MTEPTTGPGSIAAVEWARYVDAVPGLRERLQRDPQQHAIQHLGRDLLQRVEQAIVELAPAIEADAETFARNVIRQTLFETTEDDGPERLTRRIESAYELLERANHGRVSLERL
jgi:hypothetical protein